MSDDSSNRDFSEPSEALAATVVESDGLERADASTSAAGALAGHLLTGETGAHVVDGRYRLVALLGQGGMGSVYRATDLALDETVALKTLKKEFVDDGKAVERFRAEVRLARRVTHPNVARTFDFGMCGNVPYLTMEFIDGEDLASVLKRERRLSVRRFLELALAVGKGLRAAHAVGVVHRDLKPQNVIVANDGRVLLTDFGIARASQRESGLTGKGTPLGTPAYMAPEQVQGDAEIDERADIYALGVMFFEMLSAKLPFEGNTPVSTALARLIKEAPDLREARADVPEALVAVIERCLAREREQRFANADSLVAALEALDGAQTPSSSGASTQLSRESMPAASPSLFAAFDEQRDGVKAVAVLPFRNSGTDEDIYIADGLTEDLIDELSMSQTLKVRPRGAVISYRKTEMAPRQIGEALGVDVIVDGSIRRSGDRLRVRVGLVSVDDGFQIWAKRFKGTAADLFDISENAARAIVDALAADKLATPAPLAANGVAADSGAVDLYLKARHQMHACWFGDMSEVVGLFEQALAQAPEDPRILSGAALARARATFYDAVHEQEHVRAALGYANRALAIAPERPEPRLAIARVHFDKLEYAQALRELRQVVCCAPSNADAQELLGRIFREIGPLETAARYCETALELNPRLDSARWDLANIYALSGRWEQADELLAAGVHHPNQLEIREATRTRIDTWRKEPRWLEAKYELDSEPINRNLRRMCDFRREVLKGRQVSQEHLGFYRQALEQSLEGTRLHLVICQLGAEVFAYTGEFDQALGAIEAAVDAGLLDLMWLEHCAVFEPIRNDPRFEQSRRRVARRIEDARSNI